MGRFFKSSQNHERGNVLLIIMVAIISLALMTMMIAKSSEQQSDIISTQTRDNEINRMLTQASALGGALAQMVTNGEDASTLYTNLSVLKPGDAGFETAPHNLKIYHPLGGGIPYMADTGGAPAMGTALGINTTSIITGVGPTDVAVGDIIFVAKISTAAYCQRINQILTGSTTVPVMSTAVFNVLFNPPGTVTVDNSNCASCVNVTRLCVSNTAATAWGFYAALLPG